MCLQVVGRQQLHDLEEVRWAAQHNLRQTGERGLAQLWRLAHGRLLAGAALLWHIEQELKQLRHLLDRPITQHTRDDDTKVFFYKNCALRR